MKYLCLIYIDREQREALPASECLDYAAELRKRGLCLAAEALCSSPDIATIRVRDGKITVVDGPFAQTKEFLAGFYVLETRDLNEAVRLVARIPCASAGRTELRPVLDVAATVERP